MARTPKKAARAPRPGRGGSISPKQAQFVREYLIDLNATQAAIRAGYSPKTAAEQAARLLTNVNVAEAVQKAMARRAERTEITADQVLREFARIGFASLADVTDWGVKEIAIGFDADGKRLAPEDNGDAVVLKYVEAPFITPRNRDDLPPDIRAAVSEVSLGRDGFKIKMHDKAAALTQIGRHLGMFRDKLEHTGASGGPIKIEQLPADPQEAARAYRRIMEGG